MIGMLRSLGVGFVVGAVDKLLDMRRAPLSVRRHVKLALGLGESLDADDVEALALHHARALYQRAKDGDGQAVVKLACVAREVSKLAHETSGVSLEWSSLEAGQVVGHVRDLARQAGAADGEAQGAIERGDVVGATEAARIGARSAAMAAELMTQQVAGLRGAPPELRDMAEGTARATETAARTADRLYDSAKQSATHDTGSD